MPIGGNEETLRNVNKLYKLEMEMEEEKLENEEIKNSEQCMSFPESGQSKLNVGGEDAVLENHEAAEFTVEAVAEMIEPLAVAEEGGGGMIVSGSWDPRPEMKVEEEFKRVDDAKVAELVTDAGDARPFSESQMGARGYGLSVDPQLETKAEEEFRKIIDTGMEAVVTDIGEMRPFPELQIDARGDELPATKVGMEACDDKAEREMVEGEKIEEVGGAEIKLAESWAVENETETVVQGDEEDGEKVDILVNGDVGTAEKPAGIEDEKVDPAITEEIPITDVETKVEVITEVNTDVVNIREQEQVHKLGGDMGYVGADVRDEFAENKEVAAKESLKLDEPVDVTKNREHAVVEEELTAGNIKMETEAGVEMEMTRNDVAEVTQLTDAEAERERGNEVVADKIQDEGIKNETEETWSGVDEPGEEMDDSPAALEEEDETKVPEAETGTQDIEMETETDITETRKASGGKRKRVKSSKSPSISKATAKASSRKWVGEDVCFICFDGGDLVLCDRRGCPKAYHPSCVNRDEAFFRAKGRWNCGWHLCSICEKNARFMCYTCTFSLCKNCIKDAVILCVRGNKGFCETCMRTIMLIENDEQGNKDNQIDFNDRSSWEYLFKDYYTELKSKLSLSSVEVAKAKNPWKGTNMLTGRSKQESSEAQADANDGGSGSDDSVENLETVKPKRRKIRKQSKSLTKEEELVGVGVAAGDKAASLSDNSEWASKELLELVSHMKNGDTSILSQFDVQAILLEYIKRNKLRDPRRKSQIICDARLQNLFGKPRVGHFEMLKLLESRFLLRDDQNDDVQGSVVDTENNQLDVDGNADLLTKSVKDRTRKTRKKGDNRGPQSNLDDYAAIGMHNISLIYLRRKLMEDLLEDVEKFHDKVVGMFVRIRISGSIQKQDLYRLVQIVGTSKAVEPYKVGKKTTDIMVEILNLDKTEVISIDTISNQEFTKEECNRLRQSIKCGLNSRLTVGEILDKTMEIQAARVNDWLESEILRLSHLRDRASDLGHRKELRECVEKLQLLKTPEERRRRLEEIPEIHADPKMDPSYESDENDSKTEDSRRDSFMRYRGSKFSRRGTGPISPGSDNSVKDTWSGAGKVPNKDWELSRNLSGNNFPTNVNHSGEIVSWNLERDRHTQESNNLEKLNSASNSESAEQAMRTVSQSESFSGVPSVTSQASLPDRVLETDVKVNETEKIWHYLDPSGKMQGPFSVVQLRKWSNTGYFPADLRIWRTTEKQDDSILLADALAGKFQKELPAVDNIFPATNAFDSPRILAGHSGKSSGTSLNQDRERPNVDQNPGTHSKLSVEKWVENDLTTLPSPTSKQSNAGSTGGEGRFLTGSSQSVGINGLLQSPTVVSPNIGAPALSSVLNSVVQLGTAFSPTLNPQQGILGGSANSLHTQSTVTIEPYAVQMHSHLPTFVQPVQPVNSQIPQAETQGWGTGGQSGQPQGYVWGTTNAQNSAGNFSNSGTMAVAQPDFWRPTTLGSQPNTHPPATPNTSLGVRPENPNTGWGTEQANPNMGWGNPVPVHTNMNWGPPMQAPNTQVPMPGSMNSGWAATQGWVPPPVQGSVPGIGWAPPSGNAVPPNPVQGPAGQGNTNQPWGAPPGNHGSWGGEQNHNGGHFSGQRGAQGRDSGFGGGGPWNRQPSNVGAGPRQSKRDTVCPYNANGRCKKGARCDYLHM